MVREMQRNAAKAERNMHDSVSKAKSGAESRMSYTFTLLVLMTVAFFIDGLDRRDGLPNGFQMASIKGTTTRSIHYCLNTHKSISHRHLHRLDSCAMSQRTTDNDYTNNTSLTTKLGSSRAVEKTGHSSIWLS
ncbi:hypothetical protein BofuT4_P099560.1 [Botrytis cinerea T4]|uniref:Uncharacterized protein n=1 Tax=Botryotinia fuckeliana (strain T4) TaxID=999810 RepID=G2YC76_BOTF4|nr:hypothetical protein BofuT4_P099560.1 [Botrytis cinerea T4]